MNTLKADKEPPVETPSVNESESPVGHEVSEDGLWTLPEHGGKLKRTNEQGTGGRLSKQQVRERILGLMNGPAFVRDQAILKGSCLCPACKVKFEFNASDQVIEGAANRAYKYGLGSSDEVLLRSDEVPRELGALLGEYADRIPKELALELVEKTMQRLHVKGF